MFSSRSIAVPPKRRKFEAPNFLSFRFYFVFSFCVCDFGEAFLLSDQPRRYGSGGTGDGSRTVVRSGSREVGNFDAADASHAAALLRAYNRHEGANGGSANLTTRNLCYCSYGAACDHDEICVKHALAACFHAVRQVYVADDEASEEGGAASIRRIRRAGGFMQTQHFYGCAPFERGTNASHLTCNSWRSVHGTPTSISCCYEGRLCNANVSPPTSHIDRFRPAGAAAGRSTVRLSGGLLAAMASMAVGSVVGGALLLLVLLMLAPVIVRRHRRYAKKHLPPWLWRRLDATFGDGANGTGDKSADVTSDQSLDSDDGSDAYDDETTGSGSDSGAMALNQRTIALDLQLLETVARGRYGEVRKALYRGSIVAVKTFYTTEEESWRNERDIYQTQMLNHENILQYIAADISSSVESLTQMMLITDYHAHGSLYDYLRDRGRLCAACQLATSDDQWPSQRRAGHNCECRPLSISEALHISFSILSGLEHLHNALQGTGDRRKPEVAHRDIKTKNVIVKRPGVCCVADFGLAVRCEHNNVILPERINVQVGTKRYMAPEVLARSLNASSFDAFKAADIYSVALVLWEVLNVVRFDETDHVTNQKPPPSDDDEENDDDDLNSSNYQQRAQPHIQPKQNRRIISRSSSSGIATGASDRSGASSYLLLPPPLEVDTVDSVDEYSKEAPHLPPGVTCASGTQIATRWRHVERPAAATTHLPTDTVCLHRLPYQEIIECDPSLDDMYRIVCKAGVRPVFSNGIDDPLVGQLAELLRECWSPSPSSRHTALKIKKEIGALIPALTGQMKTFQ